MDNSFTRRGLCLLGITVLAFAFGYFAGRADGHEAGWQDHKTYCLEGK